MSSKRKILIGCLSLALVVSLAIGGSLAFLTDSEEKENVFTVGNLDIRLDEKNWVEDNGKNLTPGSTMMKDPIVTAVTNDSYMRVYVSIIENIEKIPNPAYVDEATTPGVPKEIDNPAFGKPITNEERLNLIYRSIYYDSTFDADTPTGAINVEQKYSIAQLDAITSVKNGVNVGTGAKQFTYDGTHSTTGVKCYNYNSVFKEGDAVTVFTNIVIPTDWQQSDMDKLGEYKIVIYAQAIQSDGFEDADAAFTALDGEVAAGRIQRNHGETGLDHKV